MRRIGSQNRPLRRNIISIVAMVGVWAAAFGCSSPSKRTHPSMDERIKKIQAEIENLSDQETAKVTTKEQTNRVPPQGHNPSDNMEKRIELAKAYLSVGAFDDAEQALVVVLSDNPKHVEGLLLLATVFRTRPQPELEAAARLLERAVAVQPDNIDVHLNLAQVYSDLGADTKATEEFKKVLELSDDPAVRSAANAGLLAIYERQEKSKKAARE